MPGPGRITPLSPTVRPIDAAHPPSASRSRFYFADIRPSPSFPSDSVRSSHAALPSLPASGAASPLHRRPSRASLGALRSALQAYQVPNPPEQEPLLPAADIMSQTEDLHLTPARSLDLSAPITMEQSHPLGARSMSGLRSAFEEGPGGEVMDALVEIHRVLYRGKEDLKAEGRSLGWSEQGNEVKRVVERWFEGDCVYDHPFVKLTSRQSLLTHFILLHLFSTLSIPSLSPSSLLEHARGVTSLLRNRWLGEEGDAEADAEAGALAKALKQKDIKGKGKMVLEEDWLGLPSLDPATEILRARKVAEKREGQWWKLWDVSADCTEIGEMECYDGYHMALIQHVVSLTLFPSLANRQYHLQPSTSASSLSEGSFSISPPSSFLTKLAACVAIEFDYLLHWDLPISTVVQFNEVGKATHVRDIIDIRDLIETFVPFAKRINWLTRRVTGLFSSSLGSIALALVPGPSVRTGQAVKVEAFDKWDRPSQEIYYDRPRKAVTPEGLGFGRFTRPRGGSATSDEVENSLGLEGVGNMAPDCDAEALDA